MRGYNLGMSEQESLEWWEEEREPTLQEAWEMLSDYISRELEPLAGQDGTAEIWQCFDKIEAALKPQLEKTT